MRVDRIELPETMYMGGNGCYKLKIIYYVVGFYLANDGSIPSTISLCIQTIDYDYGTNHLQPPYFYA